LSSHKKLNLYAAKLKIEQRKSTRKGNRGLEMSLQKRILLTAKGYASQSTIHGIAYISDERFGISRLLWICAVIASLSFTAFQTTSLYNEWQNEPVITTLETIALPIKEIEFPAITICPQGKLNGVVDAVLFKQMSEYIKNKTIGVDQRKRRSVSNKSDSNDQKNDATVSLDQLMKYAEEFLNNVYPGAKKKPTKLISLMTSDNPEATLQKEAVLLPMDDDKCDNSANNGILKSLNKQLSNDNCPEGFNVYGDVFCVHFSGTQRSYEKALDYCESQQGSSLLYIDSAAELEPFHDYMTSIEDLIEPGI
jgi:hypothetical protein